MSIRAVRASPLVLSTLASQARFARLGSEIGPRIHKPPVTETFSKPEPDAFQEAIQSLGKIFSDCFTGPKLPNDHSQYMCGYMKGYRAGTLHGFKNAFLFGGAFLGFIAYLKSG